MMKKITKLTVFSMTAAALFAASCQAAIIPAHGPGQIGYRAEILCQNLSVRESASADSASVQTLHYGDLLIVDLASENGFIQCFLTDDVDGGPAGYVNTDYIIIDPSWYRADYQTPVYAWNDTTAPKVALLDQGTTLPILKDEGDWLIVSLRAATGWIHK